jgi:hypothetical protein
MSVATRDNGDSARSAEAVGAGSDSARGCDKRGAPLPFGAAMCAMKYWTDRIGINQATRLDAHFDQGACPS